MELGEKTKEIKILIVDDLEFMRSAIKEILLTNGIFSVDEAENGKIGVDRYQSNHPDVVLLDITMPVMDGLTALKKIREICGNAKVIMCPLLIIYRLVVQRKQNLL